MACTMQRTKQTLEGLAEEEGSESSNWSHLPRDISESILKLLSLRDYLQFGLVCTSWRTILANAIASKHCLPVPQLPFLILNKSTPGSNAINLRFFDLNKQKFINLKGPLFKRNQYCCGCFEGWLFMVDNIELLRSKHSSPFYLLNPVSGVRIVLPSQLAITPYLNSKQPCFGKVVVSSNPNCEDCILVGLIRTFSHIAVCKLVNKCWTLIEAEINMVFLDLEIIGKTLYVLVQDGGGESTIFYDLEDANAPKLNMLVSLKHKPERHTGSTIYVQEMTIRVTDSHSIYLAKDNVCGELLMIRMLIDYAYDIANVTQIGHITFIDEFVIPPRAKGFRLWKLDKCCNQWLELGDLDGRLLYLKDSGSVVFSNDTSLKINDPTQEFARRNCIYFVASKSSDEDEEQGSLHAEIGRFCLNDKSMRFFRLNDLSPADQATKRSSFWFIPNILS